MDSTWTFSDGTTLELGGKVEGAGKLADALRHDVRGVKDGLPLSVTVWPPPGGDVQLDLTVPHLVDIWARDTARVYDVEVTKGPEVEIPPAPYDTPDEAPAGIVH